MSIYCSEPIDKLKVEEYVVSAWVVEKGYLNITDLKQKTLAAADVPREG